MAILLYCFVQNTNNSHLRVLQKLADKLAVRNRSVLPAFLTRLFLFENEEGMSNEVFNFYLEHAGRGLHNSSPVTRTKCITVLSYLSRIRLEPILPLVGLLRKQQNVEYWELKGQLLIFASNALIAFHADRDFDEEPAPSIKAASEKEENSAEKENSASKKSEAAVQDLTMPDASSVGGGHQQTASRIVGSACRNNGLQSQHVGTSASVHSGSKGTGVFGEIEITEKVIKEYEEIFFEIINAVFTPHAPKATVKIGLIYLAKIMDLYPEFTATYLNILLSCPENVRSSTLDLNPIPGTEEEVYVSGVNTEKYRTYGAPEEWNSLFVA